ncbi:MAG TPA: DUF6799 domain-containing protein [Saprospiraceae bacterium]|nr:DUF6799 domain-containing protein [Saprospiraceae bacterium]
MKKIIGAIFIFWLFSASAFSQQMDNNAYCAIVKNGKVKVQSAGKILSQDVKLANGTLIKTNGAIIQSDGTHLILKTGECVDTTGNKLISSGYKTNKQKDKIAKKTVRGKK